MPDTRITALYCRTAVANKAAIMEQERRLMLYAGENGFENPHTYTDNGKSGSTLRRPAMKRLIADIQEGRVGAVIVTNTARIARGFDAMGEWTLALKGIDVRCIAIDAGAEDFSGEFRFWHDAMRDIYPELVKTERPRGERRLSGEVVV